MSVRELGRRSRPAAASGSTTVASTAHLAARAGHHRLRDRRARRRPPRRPGHLRRVRRPDHPVAHRRARGLRRREVDPRRRRDPGAARDPGRRRARLPHRPLPGLLPRRLRVTTSAGGSSRARRGRRDPGGARPRRHARISAWSSPTRSRPTTSSTATSTTGCSSPASPPPTRDGVHGKDVTPYLLDWFHRESQGESLRANVALVRVQRPARGRGGVGVRRGRTARDLLLPRRPDGRRRRAAVRAARRGLGQPRASSRTSAAARPPTPRPG